MKFFIDSCLSPRYAEILRILEDKEDRKIIHLRDKFAPNTPDVTWISTLAKEIADVDIHATRMTLL